MLFLPGQAWTEGSTQVQCVIMYLPYSLEPITRLHVSWNEQEYEHSSSRLLLYVVPAYIEIYQYNFFRKYIFWVWIEMIIIRPMVRSHLAFIFPFLSVGDIVNFNVSFRHGKCQVVFYVNGF